LNNIVTGLVVRGGEHDRDQIHYHPGRDDCACCRDRGSGDRGAWARIGQRHRIGVPEGEKADVLQSVIAFRDDRVEALTAHAVEALD
jgi:hypothetical protein